MDKVKASWPLAAHPSNRRLVLGLVGTLMVCLWCFVGFWSVWERHSVFAATEQSMEQLNAAVEEQTRGLFKQAETFLMVARHWVQAHPDTDPGTAAEFLELVDHMRNVSGGRLDIRMVTRQGILRYIPDRGQALRTNVSDRDYFRAQQDPATKGYFIAKPVLSRVTGKWGIPISIPVERAGGDVAVLFVAIEVDSVSDIFESERVKPNGTISILRQDGVFMFRSPMETSVLATSIADTATWKQHLGAVGKGVYQTGQAVVDGRSRMVTFSRVSGYPLVVLVSVDIDDLLGAWRVHTLALFFVALVVSVFCMAFGRALLGAMAAEERVRGELEHLMLTDPLTGVGNRRMLTQRLIEEIARAHRYGRSLTIAFFDIDYFKRINDRYGHPVGDTVLTQVAACLQGQLRKSDHVGRFGGEEFVVLLVETSLEDALVLVERMRAAVAALHFPDMPDPLTISAGVAEACAGESAQDLLQRSDRALYQAKANGRDRTCVDRGAD
ncbi:sensor domain-containing diguanylate cyclase [Rhodoferax sp.]|uniref:sensor domain-containing diguanylate cyclase n=1 Tax=Rhodoferax sp. TaxID=50421 RepID=UPI0026054433|nr:sensor domain-containing diguanylate cyclase [Rhodoferax sp.]MDD2927196.1 sensor domain-containing diguanylate cyclase [Rhodoferax sp.]